MQARDNFIKSDMKYYFLADAKGDIYTDNLPIIHTQCHTTQIFLHGVVYNYSKEALLAYYLHYKELLFSLVQGSFVMFIIDQGSLTIVTDRFNSKKAYYLYDNNQLQVSNDFDYFSSSNLELNLGGVAYYLANGTLVNNFTIFQNVKSFSRASVSTFKRNEFSNRVYDNYEFNYVEAESEEGLKQQLTDLIVDSVKKTLRVCEKPVLSLSAGFDARGILGVLGEKVKTKSLDCFSYATAECPKPETDGYVSKQLAARYGFNHSMVKSYDGDLINHLEKIAQYGKGIANFCDELGAWTRLELSRNYTDILVGDEVFGWSNVPLNAKEEVLDSINVKGSSSIRCLEKYITKNTFRKMQDSIDWNLVHLYNKARHIEALHDKKDFLYLEQRISNVLMPWREMYASKVGFVHNPFLDEKILDFMRKVPPCLRKDKKLFRSTISEMFPELYKIPRATDSGYQVNWEAEIIRFRDALISHVKGADSLLDDIIPKQSLIKFIHSQGSKLDRVKKFSSKAVNCARRKSGLLNKVVTFLFGPRTSINDNTTVLLRILVLRIYLGKESQNEEREEGDSLLS